MDGEVSGQLAPGRQARQGDDDRERDDRQVQDDQVPGGQRTPTPEPAPPPRPSAGFTAPPRTGRFAELDAFRGIAVLMVLAYHYVLRYDVVARDAGLAGHAGLPVDWARPGLYGVHLFFMISGFVICWSLSTSNGLRGFALSRFSRIYPAFWVAVLTTFSIVHAFGLTGREVDVATLAVNLTMLQDWVGVERVDSAYWSLTVELTFYAWAALLYAGGQLHRAELFFLPAMALGAIQFATPVELPWALQMLLIVKHAHLFAAGIVYYRVHRGEGRPRDAAFLLLTIACGFAIYPPVDALLLAAFHVPFALAVTGRLGWIAWRPLTWLGGISYTLYLLHQNIGYVIIREAGEAGLSAPLAIVLATAIVLALAQALSTFVERPASRALRRRRAPARGPADERRQRGRPGEVGRAAAGSEPRWMPRGPRRSRPLPYGLSAARHVRYSSMPDQTDRTVQNMSVGRASSDSTSFQLFATRSRPRRSVTLALRST